SRQRRSCTTVGPDPASGRGDRAAEQLERTRLQQRLFATRARLGGRVVGRIDQQFPGVAARHRRQGELQVFVRRRQHQQQVVVLQPPPQRVGLLQAVAGQEHR